MPDDPPIAQPAALDYATLDADGNPDRVPEAEAAIDRGEKPRAIAKHFRKSRLARLYIQKSLRRRFSADSLGDRCLQCSRATSMVVTVEWEIQSRLGSFGLVVNSADLTSTVETHHCLCEACGEPWFKRQILPAQLVRIGRWIYVASFIAYVLSQLVLPRSMRPSGTTMLTASLIAFGGSFMLIGVGRLMFRRTWPRNLLRQVPRWCKPNTLIDYCDRSELRDDGDPKGSSDG